jgi:hypothetical protein
MENTARLGLPRYYNILFHRMGYRVTTIVTGITAGRAIAQAKKNGGRSPQGLHQAQFFPSGNFIINFAILSHGATLYS